MACPQISILYGQKATVHYEEIILHMSYRTYKIGHKTLPSVTTILEATQGDERAGNLGLWYATKKNAHIINESACERGNALDAYLKQSLDRNSGSYALPLLPELQPYANQLEPWIKANLSKRHISNHIVYTDHWAGTLDVALMDGLAYQVVELKSKAYKVFPAALADAKMQAAAYRLGLEFCGYPVTDSVLVLVVTPYGLNDYLVSGTELRLAEAAWGLRVKSFYGGRYELST